VYYIGRRSTSSSDQCTVPSSLTFYMQSRKHNRFNVVSFFKEAFFRRVARTRNDREEILNGPCVFGGMGRLFNVVSECVYMRVMDFFGKH
jgi:hypothetical protein